MHESDALRAISGPHAVVDRAVFTHFAIMDEHSRVQGAAMLANQLSKPSGNLTIRVIAMPSNTNAAGDVFGGWVMSQMDLAAGSAAGIRSQTKTVTVSIDSVSFLAPMAVGDELSIYTDIVKVGRTSMTVEVQAWRRVRRSSERQLVTHGRFVFVALDENNRPTPIPPETPDMRLDATLTS